MILFLISTKNRQITEKQSVQFWLFDEIHSSICIQRTKSAGWENQQDPIHFLSLSSANHIYKHTRTTLLYLNLLRSSVNPVQQSTDGVKGQSLHVLQIFPHYNLLTWAAVQTQPLQERGETQVSLGKHAEIKWDYYGLMHNAEQMQLHAFHKWAQMLTSAQKWAPLVSLRSNQQALLHLCLDTEQTTEPLWPEAKEIYCWSGRLPVELLTNLYGVQWDVSPVQAVPVIVKVQSHSLPEAGQRQGLVCACGQVVAVDGVPHSVQDELVTLWKSTGDTKIQIWSTYQSTDTKN